MSKPKTTRNERRLAKKAAAKQKAEKTKKRKSPPKRLPRAQRLPGMEDAGIQELEGLANDMADVIAEKKRQLAAEKVLNKQLVDAMKKHGKTVYSHRGIHIDLSSSEKAHVVITDEDELDDTPADFESAPPPNVSESSLIVNAEG